MVILMAKIPYPPLPKKDTKQSQHREKVHGVKTRGDQAQASQGLLQQGVVSTHVKCCLPGNLLRDSVPKIFIERW